MLVFLWWRLRCPHKEGGGSSSINLGGSSVGLWGIFQWSSPTIPKSMSSDRKALCVCVWVVRATTTKRGIKKRRRKSERKSKRYDDIIKHKLSFTFNSSTIARCFWNTLSFVTALSFCLSFLPFFRPPFLPFFSPNVTPLLGLGLGFLIV